MNNYIFKVSELSNYIEEHLKTFQIKRFLVKGEITNIKLNRTILYITLADIDNINENQKREEFNVLVFSPKSFTYSNNFKIGDQIIVDGEFNFYKHTSTISIIAFEIKKDEEAKSKALLEKQKTLEYLFKLGYLDESRKLKLPRFVDHIGVISSSTAAGFSDFCTIMRSKFPCKISLFESKMQGAEAVNSMIESLNKAYKDETIDCIVITRGGGSVTDLDVFNNRELILKICERKVPIVTAIGHSIDQPIADRVADVVCVTPTDAANTINPSLYDLEYELNEFDEKLKTIFISKLKVAYNTLLFNKSILNSKSPYSVEVEKLKSKNSLLNLYINKTIEKSETSLENYNTKLKNLLNNLYQNEISKQKLLFTKFEVFKNKLYDKITYFENLKLTFLSLDPKKPMNAGYIYITKNDRIIKSSKQLQKNDEVNLVFVDGNKQAIIK